jgi:hypothetical protein
MAIPEEPAAMARPHPQPASTQQRTAQDSRQRDPMSNGRAAATSGSHPSGPAPSGPVSKRSSSPTDGAGVDDATPPTGSHVLPGSTNSSAHGRWSTTATAVAPAAVVSDRPAPVARPATMPPTAKAMATTSGSPRAMGTNAASTAVTSPSDRTRRHVGDGGRVSASNGSSPPADATACTIHGVRPHASRPLHRPLAMASYGTGMTVYATAPTSAAWRDPPPMRRDRRAAPSGPTASGTTTSNRRSSDIEPSSADPATPRMP